jgi:alpha-L-fucosidase
MNASSSLLLVLSLLAAGCGDDRPAPAPPDGGAEAIPPERAEMRDWFQEARFGMFIHWGVYSVLGDGEWVMNNRQMTVADYEQLPGRFNPTAFDADAWVRLAKDAGMKYITITSKHHDGFAMWDSKVSDYDIVDRTPYRRDVLKQLAEACQRHGLTLFFYHSHLDWRHPDYYPRGKTGQHSARPDSGDFNRYLDYMNAQIAELAGGDYGRLGGFWFDGWWDQHRDEQNKADRSTHVDWRLQETYDLIHRLQPQALVGNNHHVLPFPGEDFQMFEKDLPGRNTAGFNTTEIGALPREMCETMNGSWGYNANDHTFKSAKDLIHLLVRAAGYDSNLLLNVGPTPEGTFQPEVVARLQAIGQWTQRYGETVYGTRGGPMPPQDWGVSTRKGGQVYVHVLDAAAPEALTLPGTAGLAVRSARRLDTGAAVPFATASDVTLTLPAAGRDTTDTVVVLEVEG